MYFSRSLIHTLLISMAIAPFVSATTIVQRTGNNTAVVPLDFAHQYGQDTGAAAVEWTQTSSYSNVSVSAVLYSNDGGVVNYWLADSLNAPIQHILASGTFTPPSNPGNVNLFQMSSLGPGDYFLIMASSDQGGGWLYNYPGAPAPTQDTGVLLVGEYLAPTNDNGFIPRDTYQGRNYPLEFSVTGTLSPATAPEPATLGAMGIALIGLATFRRRIIAIRQDLPTGDGTLSNKSRALISKSRNFPL